jgi:serine/threonine-protein phosphatase with EF-hands
MGSGASTTVKKPDTFKFHSGVEGGNVEENLAALHVQSWCRKKISKRKSKRKVNWKIYSEIEYQDECLGMKMHKMFCNLKVLQECLERNSGLPEDTVTDGAMQHEDGGDGLKSIRAGPFGIDPNDFDHDDVVRAIEKFQSGEQIGLNILRSIVVRGYKLNSRFPNVRHLNITKTGCCVVVGDIHGQLEDLLMIFEKAGLPSDSNPYVFNGDFVDRGDNGVEVMAIYLMFQILYPDSVFINRGNHEDFLINKQFGFENEVFKKYVADLSRRWSSRTTLATLSLFSSLPSPSTLHTHTPT